MTYLSLILFLLPALVAQWKGCRPSTLFGAAAFGFGTVAVIGCWAALSDTSATRWILSVEPDRAYHDTHHLIARSNYLVSIAAMFALFGAGNRLHEHLSGPALPRMTKALFWLLLASISTTILLSSILTSWRIPLGYVDVPGVFRYVEVTNFGTVLISGSATIGLVVMLLLSFGQYLLNRNRRP